MVSNNGFYKNNEDDVIWWVDTIGEVGTFEFSFDRKIIYNLFRDYYKLTPKQKEIFDRENPALAGLFSDKYIQEDRDMGDLFGKERYS